jgi:hypothetical protein
MARFYAEMQGNRGMISRMGTPKSGLWAHIRGWHVGIFVHCSVGPEGEDVLKVYKTGGSANSGETTHIVTVTEEEA